METRTCSKCRQQKNPEYFSKGLKNRWCKQCVSDHRIKKVYGLEPNIYVDMVTAGCNSCGDKTAQLHVDHCHKTGEVRGILCHGCNLALGHLKDAPLRIINLHNYLIRSLGQ